MLEEKMAEIGIKKPESKIYLELLTIGPQPVSVIGKRMNINRTTAYSILRTLEKKGLVASYTARGIRFFVANDPNCLIGYVDRKCRTFDYYRSELLSVIPKFRSMMDVYNFQKPVVTYHDGIEGVKHVMYDALAAKSDCRAYLCLHKWFEYGLKDFLLEYKDFRIATSKVPLKAIVPDTADVRAFFDDNYDLSNDLTELLYLQGSQYLTIFEDEFNIYDDKLAIIHLDKGQEYGVIIQSREVANMQKSIFDMAWKGFQN